MSGSPARLLVPSPEWGAVRLMLKCGPKVQVPPYCCLWEKASPTTSHTSSTLGPALPQVLELTGSHWERATRKKGASAVSSGVTA